MQFPTRFFGRPIKIFVGSVVYLFFPFSHFEHTDEEAVGANADPGGQEDNNIDLQDDYHEMLKEVAEKWLLVQLTHRVSISASNSFWEFAVNSIPKLSQCKNDRSIKKAIPGYIHLRRKMYKEQCPKVHMKFVYLNKNTEAIEIVHTNTNPAKQYNRINYVKLYEEAHFEVGWTSITSSSNLSVSC